MARRTGSKRRMSKVTKRRTYRRRKPAKRQYRKRQRNIGSEIEADTTRMRDYKGKKVEPENSDDSTSLATSLQELSDETSAGRASYSTESTPGKAHNDSSKNKRKSRKELKEINRDASSNSKTTTERTPTKKFSKKHSSKRQRYGEEQTQVTRRSESAGKPSESAGSGNIKRSANNAQDGNKGEPKDAKMDPCGDTAGPKGDVVEGHQEEESSSSSG